MKRRNQRQEQRSEDKHAILKRTDRAVLKYLKELAQLNGNRTCLTSIPKIANACDISNRQVQISTRRLIEAAYIERVGYDFVNANRAMPLKAVDEYGNGGDRPNSIWEEFIRALWSYQYVQTPSKLKPNLLECPLSNAVFDESQGVTGIAATIYVLTQRRAISSGEEKITVGLIRSVVRDSQTLIGPMLEQVKQKGWRGLHFIPDISV